MITTHLRLAATGEIRQVATTHTAAGEANACSARASVQGAEDVTLRCVLSQATRRRLQRRWLALTVLTRFSPDDGEPEVISRRLSVRRLPTK